MKNKNPKNKNPKNKNPKNKNLKDGQIILVICPDCFDNGMHVVKDDYVHMLFCSRCGAEIDLRD